MKALKMANVVKVDLLKTGPAKYIATNESGYTAELDGPSSMGGEGKGLRPMELVLMGLIGCTSFDVQTILQKQKYVIQHYQVYAEGERVDTTPAVYKNIRLIFEVDTSIPLEKLDKAVSLSMEKYCSVATMLKHTANITYQVRHQES